MRAGHPLGDRRVLPADRYTPHMDLGTQLFEFRLRGGKYAALADSAERLTQTYCERPFCTSFFPSGEGERPAPGLRLEGDGCVVLTARKQYEYGRGQVLRLFNPTDAERMVKVITGERTLFAAKLPPGAFETYLADGDVVRNISADEFPRAGE